MKEIWCHPNFWASSIELTASGYVIMTTSWLHTLLGIIPKAEIKLIIKKQNKNNTKKRVKIRKLILHPVLIELSYRTCLLLKERPEKKKKKKKMGLLFLGSGTPTFKILKEESRTPTFKILVRTLREVNLPAHLMYPHPATKPTDIHEYIAKLTNCIQKAHDTARKTLKTSLH